MKAMKIIVQYFSPNEIPPCPSSFDDKIPLILTKVKQGKTKVLLKIKTAASFLTAIFTVKTKLFLPYL